MKCALVLLVFFSSLPVFGQQCDKVLFTGKVVDTLRPQNFYNLMIVNRRTGQGVFGQPNGTFSVYVNNGDSISISVREYPLVKLVVKADSNCQFLKTIFIEPR